MTSTLPSPGYAARLRDATAADHSAAESSPFVTELLAGRLPREAYADLLAQNARVYEVLEQAVAVHAGDPGLQPFLHPGLTRLPSLEADLLFLAGPDWRSEFAPLPATLAYVERLREVAFDWPAGLVAHHYLRYLGDLSGGQIVRTLVGRAYDLTLDGVRFYVFPDLPRPKPFKDAYRAALDAVPWAEEERARVVEEVSLAFRLNRDLFADLAARHLPPT
jgi:heme oxygenase